jgi:hypothetical protein
MWTGQKMTKTLTLHLALLLCLLGNAWGQTAEVATLEKVGSLQAYTTELGESKDTVVIGNMENPSVFSPEITFTKWSNECQLTIIPDKTWFTSLTPPLSADKVSLEIGDSKIGFYYKPASEDLFKCGLILKEKPKTNTWVFKIAGWQDYNFCHNYDEKLDVSLHPEILEEETDEYWRVKANTKSGSVYIYKKYWNGWNVYHKSKKNNQYATGRFCKILPVILIDADGKKIGNANLNIYDGFYIITVNQKILDTAKYPIIFNDTFTFGYSSAAWDSTENWSGDYINGGYSYSPASDGTLTKISVYLSANDVGRAVIYKIITGNDTLIDISAEVNSGAGGWTDCSTNIDQNVVSADNYMLGWWADSSWTVYYDTGSHIISDNSMTYHATNNPAAVNIAQYYTNKEMGIYATYEAGGGAASNSPSQNNNHI